MTKDRIDLINIIKSAFIDYQVTDVDVDKVYELAKANGISTICYYGLKKNKCQITKEIEKNYQIEVFKDSTQILEKDEIYKELTKNNIHFLPLKGIIIKELYKNTDMRMMADIDILVETSKLKQVKEVMISLGYKTKSIIGNHDVYHKLPFMNIEIHRNVIDESYKYFEYYKNVWEQTYTKEGNEFHHYLENEDYYIYMLAHSAKHFFSAGMGIRVLIDIWVYTNSYNLNFNYIDVELKKLNIFTFSNNLLQLSRKIFTNTKLSEDEIGIIDYMISSGTYGTFENSVIISKMYGKEFDKKTIKRKYIIKRIFPPFSKMKRRNPILVKLPILLPWFYMTRIIKAVFKKTNYTSEIKDLTKINKQKISNLEKINNQNKDKSGDKDEN